MAEGYSDRLEDYRQSVKNTVDRHTFVQRALEGNVQVHMHLNVWAEYISLSTFAVLKVVAIIKDTYSPNCGYTQENVLHEWIQKMANKENNCDFFVIALVRLLYLGNFIDCFVIHEFMDLDDINYYLSFLGDDKFSKRFVYLSR